MSFYGYWGRVEALFEVVLHFDWDRWVIWILGFFLWFFQVVCESDNDFFSFFGEDDLTLLWFFYIWHNWVMVRFLFIVLLLGFLSFRFQQQPKQKSQVQWMLQQWMLQQWMIHQLQNSLGPLTIFLVFPKNYFLTFSVLGAISGMSISTPIHQCLC